MDKPTKPVLVRDKLAELELLDYIAEKIEAILQATTFNFEGMPECNRKYVEDYLNDEMFGPSLLKEINAVRERASMSIEEVKHSKVAITGYRGKCDCL